MSRESSVEIILGNRIAFFLSTILRFPYLSVKLCQISMTFAHAELIFGCADLKDDETSYKVIKVGSAMEATFTLPETDSKRL